MEGFEIAESSSLVVALAAPGQGNPLPGTDSTESPSFSFRTYSVKVLLQRHVVHYSSWDQQKTRLRKVSSARSSARLRLGFLAVAVVSRDTNDDPGQNWGCAESAGAGAAPIKQGSKGRSRRNKAFLQAPKKAGCLAAPGRNSDLPMDLLCIR